MKLRSLLLVFVALISIFVFASPDPASAADDWTSHNIWNGTSSVFHARCWGPPVTDHRLIIVESVGYQEDTWPVSCNAFSVGDNRNVRYVSWQSGIYYWSGCGRYLPHTNPRPAGDYGWAYIGNDVSINAVVAC